MPTFTFRYHLPLFRDVALYQNELEFLSTKDVLTKFDWNWRDGSENIFNKLSMYFYYFPNKEEVFRLWNLSFEESPIHFTHISKIGRNWRNGFGMNLLLLYFYYFFVTTWLFNWNNLKLIYKNALFPNLVKISPVFLEENIFKRCPRGFFYKSFCYFISCRPFLNKLQSVLLRDVWYEVYVYVSVFRKKFHWIFTPLYPWISMSILVKIGKSWR